MKEIPADTIMNLKLTAYEINNVLEILSKQPFERVSNLINNIQNQVSNQIDIKKEVNNSTAKGL